MRSDEILLKPCAYLHNCATEEAIKAPIYESYIEKAPVFLKQDSIKLQNFIKHYVRYGDADSILYRIDNGKIRPSKSLADCLLSMLDGNCEFLMIDDQKLVYESALALIAEPDLQQKNVLIVEGGPGTGKSVVAVNLLVELTARELLAQYVTKNAAPRAVYESKLSGSYTKSRISNLFKGSGAYVNSEKDEFDVLIVDEAHRLNAKSGMFQNLGENQIKEIVNAGRLNIFFIDEDQRVTWRDIGEKAEIRKWAEECDANIYEMTLASQFRCNGSDGYLSWIDHSLQMKETANPTLSDINYDVRVFDSPIELREKIFEKNAITNKARMVAGYCWDWSSKKDPSAMDIVFPEFGFSAQWNLASDGSLWITKPETVKEIGCIHTCQGLELDYIGVIIGPDLIVREGVVQTDGAKRSKMDSSIKGYKKQLKIDPEEAKKRAATIIRNTYRTLMTRGQKGCYIYCTDPETNEYFKKAAMRGDAEGVFDEDTAYSKLPLRLLEPEEVLPFANSVPVFDLRIAAGGFSEVQAVDECDWVELPEDFVPRKGQFVARVVGESMNKRIPNGSWCLFKENPGGTRQGKVVLVQHRDIQDPDHGGQYTVKVYSSQKQESEDGSWRHSRIDLSPDSTIEGYKSITLSENEIVDLKVIGELVAVLN